MEKVPLGSAVTPRAGNKWLMIALVINPNPSPTIVHLNLEVLNFRGGLSCVPEPWNGVKWWQKYKQDLENWVLAVKLNILRPAERDTSAWECWCLTFTLKAEIQTLVCLWKIWLDKLVWFLFLKINLFLEKCATSLMKYNSTVKLLHYFSHLY